MKSKVYFTDFRANSRENLPDKLARLLETAGVKNVLTKGDLTGIKLHFGEKGNTAFIRPLYISRIVKTIREAGAIPFLTDANTLYAGTRSDSPAHIKTAVENGFAYSSIDNAPIIIADGLRGNSEVKIEVNKKHCSHVYIGSEIVAADALIGVAHFKGHELSGFGGALKNIGMGCASRKGKLDQHSTVSPKIKKKKCQACAECIKHCPVNAIQFVDKKAWINPEICIGCGECIIRCTYHAVNIIWNQTIPVFLEKMMEYVFGVVNNKQGKIFFINFVTNISPACDCLPYNDSPIVRDIGILASTNPVAIDQASVDLINAEEALPGSLPEKNRKSGEDKFKGLYPDVDWSKQLDYAEYLGLGTRSYELVKMGTLSWKK